MCSTNLLTYFGVNSWITQMIRQWIPACWSGDRKCTAPKSAVANLRNWLTTAEANKKMRTNAVMKWTELDRDDYKKLQERFCSVRCCHPDDIGVPSSLCNRLDATWWSTPHEDFRARRDKSPRSTQPGHPFMGRCNEYQPKDGDALQLGSKGRYGSPVGGG